MKKLSSLVLGISLLASSALYAQGNGYVENQTISNETTVAYLYPEAGNNN
ncbi:MAG: hypothetical protein HRT43_03105 [Campylobacteraceae bacterium]|nr:hypothetical protein [Campylobacteraceae bacterium]